MDTFRIEGILRIYQLPDDLADEAEYQRWWHRFTLAEKERIGRLMVEAKNLVTSAGRSQVLTFMGNTGATTAFAQQFAVGTGAIASVQASDTTLATELYRAAPSSYTIVGNVVTVSTLFSGSNGAGTYTNAGFFGNGATSTPGSGTLMTHLLCTHTKGSTSETCDYAMSMT